MVHQKIFKKIIIGLIILIVITIALGFFYYQRNIFSSERLRFEITAPETVTIGEEIEYILRYRNNSDTRLEDVILIFEYPDGAIVIEDEEEMEEEMKIRGEFRRELFVGELNPGEEKTTIFRAILIGRENESLEAQAQIRYVPKNLAARFDLKRTHVSQISEIPIDFTMQVPSMMDPGREENIRVQFSSKIDYPLSNLEVRLNYPEGFSFKRSVPETERREKNRWEWPVLNRGEMATIDINGVLSGGPGEYKSFSAALGVMVGERFIKLKEVTKGTAVARSNILMAIRVNGDEEYIASPGELLHYEVVFLNIGQETINNLYLLVELDDKTLDLATVEAVGGRFQEERSSIIWSYTFDFDLLSLEKGEGGRVEFWVRAKDDITTEPKINVKAQLDRATKIIETRIGTDFSLRQSAIRDGSPFDSLGPFPFREDETSNYTIRWFLKNSFAPLHNVKIETVLPEGARITGEKQLKGGTISFDSRRRKVTILFDEILAQEEQEILLEVEITPFSDFTENDIVIYETEVVAEDRHAGRLIRKKIGAFFLGQI